MRLRQLEEPPGALKEGAYGPVARENKCADPSDLQNVLIDLKVALPGGIHAMVQPKSRIPRSSIFLFRDL